MQMPLVLTNRRRRGGSASAPAFSPIDVFATGSPGIWLDPSDLSTMFSDRAGTTAVTTPGTVVGLRLDKSKGGVGTNGATRRNLFSWSADFTNSVWTKSAASISSSSVVAPDGQANAQIYTNGGAGFVRASTAQTSGATYTISIYAKALAGRWFFIRNLRVLNGGASLAGAAWFDLVNGNVGVTGTSLLSASISAVGDGWYRCIIAGVASTSNDLVDFGTSVTNGAQDASGGQTAYVWGAQLELASTASAYQKITADWPSTMVGNHAVAPTDAARPTYGVEPKGGRRNLLTWSEDFRDTAAAGETRPWTYTNATIPTTNNIAPDGTATADKLAETSASGKHRTYQVFGVNGTTYVFTCYLKAAERTWAYLNFGDIIDRQTWFNLSTGAVGAVGSGVTASIVSAGNGWYRCSISKTAVSNNPNFDVGIANADNSFSYTGVTGNGILIWGAQLELGSTVTPYQRVLSAYDITESGVATTHYVQYDGSDDSMSTAAIDFTATDKMSVFAGVRKLGVGGFGTIVELSASTSLNNGAFVVLGPNGTTNDYGFVSRGTALSEATVNGYESPISNILTGIGNISGDTSTLRLDGTQVAQATGDQGPGSFGSYPLFIGRRGNATLPFNGRDFGIIIVGKAASAGEITDTETWLAAKTAQVTL